MTSSRNVLTPEALAMMDAIARTGSFAAAARELGKVPSALTYNVRQLEDALDVLLFDRRSRQARFTAAGEELLNEGRRLLEEMDAVANRVRRVATGWETQLTVAVDGVMSLLTVYELCEAFFALKPNNGEAPPSGEPGRSGPGTRLRLRSEVLAGTWEALVTGQADLAIGVGMSADRIPPSGVQLQPLGEMDFVFAVAPHHPLASAAGPISDADLLRHRAVAVADSAQRLAPITVNLLPGQDVFTVASTQAKLAAQLRCLGCGYLPEPLAREHIATGRLVVKETLRPRTRVHFGYAWRTPSATAPGAARQPQLGLALRWWLAQLERPATRQALLERHGSSLPLHGA
ncbi:MAG TPA: LysR family transcriptional regulator [Albitalea sp.]|nr:LysR family transcriptional regulator [Albitalea sp.]